MKKYRRVIRTLAVFISTFYVLVVVGASGHQDYLSRMVIHEISAVLPIVAGSIEYVIYIAILPLVVFWIIVLRVTYVSEEERYVEEYRRTYGNKSQ